MFDRFFADPWNGSWLPEAFVRRDDGTFAPSIELKETDDRVIVRAELPGVDPKDVDVELHDDVLVLSGKKEERHAEKDGERARARSTSR